MNRFTLTLFLKKAISVYLLLCDFIFFIYFQEVGRRHIFGPQCGSRGYNTTTAISDCQACLHMRQGKRNICLSRPVHRNCVSAVCLSVTLSLSANPIPYNPQKILCCLRLHLQGYRITMILLQMDNLHKEEMIMERIRIDIEHLRLGKCLKSVYPDNSRGQCHFSISPLHSVFIVHPQTKF